MIYTREELIHKLMDIIFKWHSKNNSQMDYLACSNEIVDLVSTLNDEDAEAWKNIP